MQSDFLNAVEEKIAYLQADTPPAGLESIHAEMLDALIKAKGGDMQPLFQFEISFRRLEAVINDPDLPKPGSLSAEKDKKAAENKVYRSARQDATLQSLLKKSLDAVTNSVFAGVMYALQVLGPVCSLMDEPEADE